MNILVLSKNTSDYISGNYHQDLLNSIKKITAPYFYGEGFNNYNPDDSIEDVIKKSPWEIDNIDLVLVSTSWEIDDEDGDSFDPHPKINLSSLKIPKLFFLNKEYKKLDLKLEYIKKNNFTLVATVMAEERFKEWEIKTGIPFCQSHFGIDLELFKPLENGQKIYDFSFTGSLHEKYTDLRVNTKKQLFKENKLNIKSNLGLWRIFSIANPLKKEYADLKIYWAEWDKWSKNLKGQSLLPSGQDYVKLMSSSKVFFNTLSAENIFNTRFFELMATKCLIFCPEDNYYGLLTNGVNCVMFKKDFSDFKNKLKTAITDDVLREKIVNQAYAESRNHTYENRLKNIFNKMNL